MTTYAFDVFYGEDIFNAKYKTQTISGFNSKADAESVAKLLDNLWASQMSKGSDSEWVGMIYKVKEEDDKTN